MTSAAIAKTYFDEGKGVWRCPHEGCAFTYKGLATLSRHFDNKHPRANRPVWITETIMRNDRAKYEAKKSNKSNANKVDGMDYQTFKSQQIAIIKKDTPKITLGEMMKIVSQRWSEAKVAAVKPIANPPMFTPQEEEEIIAEFLAKFVSPKAPATNPCDEAPAEIETTATIATNLCREPTNDADASTIASSPCSEAHAAVSVATMDTQDDTATTAMNDTRDANDENDERDSDDDVAYDKTLIECCRTFYDGGFVQAYRHLQKEKGMFITCTNNKHSDGAFTRSFKMSIDNEKLKQVSMSDVKDALEDVFLDMVNAYTDYTTSDDFDESIDFSDDLEWLDVCNRVVNHDNIEQFVG